MTDYYLLLDYCKVMANMTLNSAILVGTWGMFFRVLPEKVKHENALIELRRMQLERTTKPVINDYANRTAQVMEVRASDGPYLSVMHTQYPDGITQDDIENVGDWLRARWSFSRANLTGAAVDGVVKPLTQKQYYQLRNWLLRQQPHEKWAIETSNGGLVLQEYARKLFGL